MAVDEGALLAQPEVRLRLRALAETYRQQRRSTMDVAKLCLELREAGLTLQLVNATLQNEFGVSPSDESTVSRYITTYLHWVRERGLSSEAWTSIGHSKLNLLAVANIGFDSQAYWLEQAYRLSYAELKAELNDKTVTLPKREKVELAEAPAAAWERARVKLQECIPEFDVPGYRLSDDKMAEFIAELIEMLPAETLRTLYDAMTENRRGNEADHRSRGRHLFEGEWVDGDETPSRPLEDAVLAALQGG